MTREDITAANVPAQKQKWETPKIISLAVDETKGGVNAANDGVYATATS